MNYNIILRISIEWFESNKDSEPDPLSEIRPFITLEWRKTHLTLL